jgi:hypothetical protein
VRSVHPGTFVAEGRYARWIDVGDTLRPALVATLPACGASASFLDTLLWTQQRVAAAQE